MSEPVTAYLRASDEPRTYALRDLDDLGRAIRAGQVDRVEFPTEVMLLASLWDGVLTAEDLRVVKVELAPPAGGAGVAVSLAGLLTAWEAWSRRRRRQRTVAGLILSLVALAAAWGVLALAAWR